MHRFIPPDGLSVYIQGIAQTLLEDAEIVFELIIGEEMVPARDEDVHANGIDGSISHFGLAGANGPEKDRKNVSSVSSLAPEIRHSRLFSAIEWA